MKTPKIFKANAVRLIRKMITAVLADPASVDQNSFPDPNSSFCNTSFCAAGHIVYAKSPKYFQTLMDSKRRGGNVDWRYEAINILDLPADVDARTLFGSVALWPGKFYIMYYTSNRKKTEAGRARARAKAFAAFWEHLLKTGGEELRSKNN